MQPDRRDCYCHLVVACNLVPAVTHRYWSFTSYLCTEFFCQLPPELATPESTAEDQAEPSDEEGQVAAALLDLNLASLHPPLPVLKKDAPAPNPAPMDISAVFECDTWVANHPTLLNCLLNYISGHPSLEMPQLKPLTQDVSEAVSCVIVLHYRLALPTSPCNAAPDIRLGCRMILDILVKCGCCLAATQ